MRFKASLATVAVALTAVGLAACSSSSSSTAASGSNGSSSTASTTSSPTLVMEGSPTGPMTVNFNPFSPSSPANTAGATNLVYEPLMQFNLEDPGSAPQPWLATAESLSANGESLTLTLRSGVKFTDGSSFDAGNVAWQFNLMASKAGASINTSGLPITNAKATGADTVVINFSSPQYTNLYNILSTIAIPEDVWNKVNVATFTDANPVGTGPYTVSTFTSQGINLVANKSYWGGDPAVQKVSFPAYDSNDTANTALENGQLDWAGNFVTDIKADFLNKSSAYNDADTYLSTQTLTPNLDKFPFNVGPNGAAGLAVREAISDGINRTQIGTQGEGGQQPGATGPASATGLVMPTDNAYVTSATSGLETTYNPSKAKSILEAAGWKLGSNGKFSYNGQELSITIEDPQAYTDYIADDQIIASELDSIGFNITVDPVSVNQFGADVSDGNFQMVNRYGSGGTTPYNQYNSWLDSADSAPLGKDANTDQERFTSSAADALLTSYAGTTNTTTQLNDIVGLEKIVASQLPVIPMVFGASWAEFSTAHFTGWPVYKDAGSTGNVESGTGNYDPAQPEGPYDEVVILHLKPVS
jgi:peptide/nickel transport system substrate-binding protein